MARKPTAMLMINISTDTPRYFASTAPPAGSPDESAALTIVPTRKTLMTTRLAQRLNSGPVICSLEQR